MTSLHDTYIRKCETPSDIHEHLPTLRYYASKCSSVVECGVRDVVSSYAFAVGLQDSPTPPSLHLIDPYLSTNVEAFLDKCSFASFVQESDLKCPLIETDFLFIDTWHVYGHLKRELERWHPVVRKYIGMHDTTVDGERGETVRVGWNPQAQSLESGIPVNEITRGLRPAIEEFLAAHPEWVVEAKYTNNNGLTILKRVSQGSPSE